MRFQRRPLTHRDAGVGATIMGALLIAAGIVAGMERGTDGGGGGGGGGDAPPWWPWTGDGGERVTVDEEMVVDVEWRDVTTVG